MELKDNMLIICNNNNKMKLLKEISSKKEILNISFLTMQQLRKKYLYDYDEQAITFLHNKYKYSIDICKMYLNNTYYVEDKLYNNKLDLLVTIKNEVNTYFIKDYLFKDSIKSKNIVVYGYDFIENIDRKILEEIHAEIITTDSNKYEPILYEFNTIEEEVDFIGKSICKLIDSGVDINKIKISNYSNEYENIITRVFKMYNIPINLTKQSLYSLNIGNKFVKYYSSNINNTIELLNKEFDSKYVNKIVNIINKYSYIDNYDLVYDQIIYDLKNTYISKEYDNTVEVVDYNTNYDDEYVFLIDFTKNTIPKTIKDEDYITDNIKELVNMNSTVEINKQIKLSTIKNLYNIKNLIITYKLKNNKTTYYKSDLVELMNLKTSTYNEDNISYSIIKDKIRLCDKMDELIKYGTKDEELSILNSNYKIDYKKYDNTFNNITNIKEYINKITLSYSTLNTYMECPFKYYMTNIIKALPYEDTLSTKIGTIFHKILEKGIKDNINIDEVITECIKDNNYNLNSKELFYINKLKPNMEYVLNKTKEHLEHSKLKNIDTEKEFIYELNDNITFKGYIDKIMYNKNDDNYVVALFDYKTYDTSIDLNLIKYGLNLQLPIYLYLVSKSNDYTNVTYAGFYIHPILPKIPDIDLKKDYKSIIDKNMMFNGITNDNKEIIEMLDDTYNNSNYIKGIKLNKDNTFASTSIKKVKSNEEINEIISLAQSKIEECINGILSGEFTINPKIYKKDQISCKYCKFNDTCFKTKKDYTDIDKLVGGDDNELDE